MPEITGFPKAEPSTFHLKVPKLMSSLVATLSFPRKKKAFNKKVPVRKNELRTRAYNNGSIHSTRSVRIGPG